MVESLCLFAGLQIYLEKTLFVIFLVQVCLSRSKNLCTSLQIESDWEKYIFHGNILFISGPLAYTGCFSICSCILLS